MHLQLGAACSPQPSPVQIKSYFKKKSFWELFKDADSQN